MEVNNVLPPGEDPQRDCVNKEVDGVAKALERVITMLQWADEHLASFQKHRESDAVNAENELSCLRNVIEQGAMYLGRLAELILAGYNIDPNKRLPRGLDQSKLVRLNRIWDAELRNRTDKEDSV
jgi:hypothetical protein